MINKSFICSGENFGSEKIVTAKLQVIENIKKLNQINRNSIIFLKNINISYDSLNLIVNLINKGVKGFISNFISKTDHGCLAAKELNVCFYQISNKIKKIEKYNNKFITLYDNKIYSGKKIINKKNINLKKIKIHHEFKINLGFPSNKGIKRLLLASDGVGFSRSEFFFSKILNNIHPYKYLEFVGMKNLTNNLADQIRPTLKILAKQKKNFWIRTDDFSVEQLVNMDFGRYYENHEKISSTGYRGIRRTIKDITITEPILRAIKKLQQEGLTNIGLFPPMVNSASEYKKWLDVLKNFKLNKLQLGLMVETPRSAIMIEEFFPYINFVVFGMNDLTSFLLAVDRNNLNIRNLFNESDPVILKILNNVIYKCKKKNIHTYLSGTLTESKYSLNKLFQSGLTGVTVNPDIRTINKVKKIIYNIENNL